ESGRAFERQLLQRVPDANVIYVDPRSAQGASDQVLQAVGQAKAVIAAVYVNPTPGKMANTVGLADATSALIGKIVEKAGAKTVFVALGNPYLATDFPAIQNYLCTFSNATVSEVSAVKALFGEIPIRGRLPVSIPNIAQRGAGIDKQATSAPGGQNANAKSGQ